MESKLDGAQTLEQQRIDLSATEEAGPYLLTSLSKGDPKPTNFASFADSPLGQPVPELILIEVKATDSIDKIKSDQSAKGKAFVSCSPAYVAGAESKIAIFR